MDDILKFDYDKVKKERNMEKAKRFKINSSYIMIRVHIWSHRRLTVF